MRAALMTIRLILVTATVIVINFFGVVVYNVIASHPVLVTLFILFDASPPK